jgi:hypothetical protein
LAIGLVLLVAAAGIASIKRVVRKRCQSLVEDFAGFVEERTRSAPGLFLYLGATPVEFEANRAIQQREAERYAEATARCTG